MSAAYIEVHFRLDKAFNRNNIMEFEDPGMHVPKDDNGIKNRVD